MDKDKENLKKLLKSSYTKNEDKLLILKYLTKKDSKQISSVVSKVLKKKI